MQEKNDTNISTKFKVRKKKCQINYLRPYSKDNECFIYQIGYQGNIVALKGNISENIKSFYNITPIFPEDKISLKLYHKKGFSDGEYDNVVQPNVHIVQFDFSGHITHTDWYSPEEFEKYFIVNKH